MKLSSLQIERFGARSGLSLSDLDSQLNVVYGPNGSGKTTVIQFIRWMFYGQCDEISRPYLTTAQGPASGSMSITDGLGHRTFHRASQPGSLLSQLTTSEPNGTSNPCAPISSSEFDRFYIISFDQPRKLGDLFNAARSHGYQLHIDQRQLDRVRALTEQIQRHRSELSRFAHIGSLDVLRSHREDKRREIENIRLDWQRRREELERQRTQANSVIGEQQMLCDRLRSVVSNIDNAIETRKRQLAEEHTQWLGARNESEQRRQSRIQEIDAQISRWQEILNEVRTRLEQVRGRISSYGDVGFSATEATDLRFFMRKLGFRIRDIEQDLHGVYDSDTWRDHEADADYLRGLLGSALNSMQNDVTRLAQTVERQQQSNELLEAREELTYLCRVERELSDLLEALARQRHNLNRESEFMPNLLGHHFLHTPDSKTDSMFPTSSVPGFLPLSNELRSSAPAENGRTDGTRYDLTSISPIELANALDDFRLRHLVERRDAAVARLNEAELELANRQRRLREIEEELSRFERDGRINVLEREIGELDEQMRQLEMRAALERTIASLEEELRRAREHTGRSEIIDEASEILRRLTNDDYRQLRVGSDYQCHVARADGQDFGYLQLSRGVQDQVYLAISLAIACAYGRKGVNAPLILNDIFVNLDATGIDSLADLLIDFAAKGHQTFVFSRHAHIRDAFSRRATKLFTLGDLDSQVTYQPTVYIPPRPYIPTVAPVMPVPAPRVELDPGPEDPTYQWVAEWQRRDPIHQTPPAPLPSQPSVSPPKQWPPIPQYQDPPIPPTTEPPPEPPVDPEVRTREVSVSDVREPLISLESPLTRAPTLADDLVQLLAELNIHNVGEFVEFDPDDIADQLAENGVTAEMIQRRQRELLDVDLLRRFCLGRSVVGCLWSSGSGSTWPR